MKPAVVICLAAALAFTLTRPPATGLGAPSHATLLYLTGDGSRPTVKTGKFQTSANWQIFWLYTCSRAKGADFRVTVYKPNGRNAGASEVHKQARSGSGTQRYQKGGSFYLLIRSTCRWQITVSGTAPLPKPTATPEVPYAVEVSPRQCLSDPLRKSCADVGYRLEAAGGTITLTQADLGYHLQFSRFGIARSSSDESLILTMYVKANKTTPKDGSLASWDPTYQAFHVTAANGHPYSAGGCGIPSFGYGPLYNGEKKEGWVCGGGIAPQYVVSTFTWSYQTSARVGTPGSSVYLSIPLADVTVTHR